jgi:excisionase family DNA binding protein
VWKASVAVLSYKVFKSQKLLTTEACAKILQVPLRKVQRLLITKELKALRIGHIWYVPERFLKNYMYKVVERARGDF